MKRQVLVTILLLTGVGCGDDPAAVSDALPETREILLPGLLGNYGPSENGDQLTVTIQLGGAATTVRSVDLRLSGTTTPGLAPCINGDEPFIHRMGISAWMEADPVGRWYTGGGLTEQSASFSRTWRFSAYLGATFDFLLDGETDLTLFVAASGLPHVCVPGSFPTATIDEAVLIVDADFAEPVQALTSGQIKAPN